MPAVLPARWLRRCAGAGIGDRLIDEFDLLERNGDQMLADAEEAADADHDGLDVSVLVGQQVVDRAEALVLVVVDVEAHELRRTPVALERRRDAMSVAAAGAILARRWWLGVCANATVASNADPTRPAVIISLTYEFLPEMNSIGRKPAYMLINAVPWTVHTTAQLLRAG